MKFKDKVVLITGASSGIGKDFALRIASEGAIIILVSRSKDKLDLLDTEIERRGGKSIVIPTDVSKPIEVKELFDKISQNNIKLDLVLNNAGLGHVKNIYDLSPEEVTEMIDINMRGMILVANYASKIMKNQGFGHIIFTSSVAGLVTLPKWSVYVASKWGITAFADCIRPELAPFNIQITTLHPGPVETEFFDPSKANIESNKLSNIIPVSKVSDVIYAGAFSNTERIIVPSSMKTFAWLYKYFPWLAKKLIAKMANQ